MIDRTVKQGKNNYYFVENGELKKPHEFGINYDRSQYFRTLIEAIEAEGILQGYDFVITIRDMDEIPVRGPHTIVIIIGDERFYLPRYGAEVLAIFRCMGPDYREIFPLRRDYIGLLIGLRELRRHLLMLPKSIKSMFLRTITGTRPAPVYLIPLGYSAKVEEPPKAINSRPYDVSFTGSVNPYLKNSRTFRDIVGTPKSVSRHRMLESLTRYSKSNPERHVYVELTSDFGESMKTGPEHFNDVLHKSKICLAPRGGSAETTRLYQAMLCGCIVISEPLLQHWFYQGAPIIYLKDWRKLGAVLESLLDAPERLDYLCARTQEWWNTCCSEPAVARFIAQQVMAIRCGGHQDVGGTGTAEGENSALEIGSIARRQGH